MGNRLSLLCLSLFLALALIVPTTVSADAITGKTVVTLGKDLTESQKQAILQEMGVSNDVQTIEVTNEEEHKYLDKYLSKETIGHHAISSAKIVIKDNGQGILVKTKNISTITESMYANAAITAGIKDADIYVTAPFSVSGTAGLTGIIKAFETATGTKIDEDKKQVANEEIVRTQEIGKLIGDPNKAAQFMNRLKEEIAKENPSTADEYKDIIINVSNEFNINLNSETINQLVQFSQNFSKLNIDWDAISQQIDNLRGNLKDVLNSEQTQGIIDTILEWFGSIFSAIGDFFTSSSSRQ
jgi:uncharacterized protein YpuA (DUF1002 family)